MCRPYSAKAVTGYVLAAIFGAFFLASLAQGYIVQKYGDFRSAIGFYFIALILLGITKLILWESMKDDAKPAPVKAKKRR